MTLKAQTHKKLEYFIFENTEVEEDTVAQMYFYVVRKLCARETHGGCQAIKTSSKYPETKDELQSCTRSYQWLVYRSKY